MAASKFPRNMWVRWSRHDVGDDWSKRPAKGANSPLLPEQQSSLESYLLKDIEFGNKIGSGSFGDVYFCTALVRALTPYLEEEVWTPISLACKVVRHQTNTRIHIELSLNDMYILRYLRHENICNLCDIIGIPDSVTEFPYAVVCMFFELCDGDLHTLLLKKSMADMALTVSHTSSSGTVFSEKLSKHWFSQIARALEYLHKNDVVHRDIKARNILYRNQIYTPSPTFEQRFLSAVFKLCDFGLSRDKTQLNLQRHWTLQEHDAAEFTDVELLGGVLFEHGIKVPPQASSMPEFEYGMLYDTLPEQWKGYSPELRDLLTKMETSNFTSSEVLQHPWLQNKTLLRK